MRNKLSFIFDQREKRKSLSPSIGALARCGVNSAKGFIFARREKRKFLSKAKGFTLIELMVTITIITILTGVGVVVYSRAQMRARNGRRKADMSGIQTALELYASENNGNYPAHGTWARSYDADPWIPGLRPIYIKSIPKETHHGASRHYHYATTSGSVVWRNCFGNEAGTYVLLMHMESESGKSCVCKSGSPYYGGTWDCYQNP